MLLCCGLSTRGDYRQTCDSERVDDGGDDQVWHCEVGDENSSGVVAGGLRLVAPADKVLDGYRGDDDQVAQSSHHGGHSQHSDIQPAEDGSSTEQRSMPTYRRLWAVHFNHRSERRLHRLSFHWQSTKHVSAQLRRRRVEIRGKMLRNRLSECQTSGRTCISQLARRDVMRPHEPRRRRCIHNGTSEQDI